MSGVSRSSLRRQLVLCVGDSISDTAWNATMYPSALGSLLVNASVFSCGIAGNTTVDAITNRLIAGGIKTYSWALGPSDPNPTTYSGHKAYVLLGINDLIFLTNTAAQIWTNLQAIYTHLTTLGMRVYPLTIMPWGNSSSFNQARDTVRASVNSSILATTQSALNGGHPISLEGLGTGASPNALQAAYDSGDGVHPSPLGARQLAAIAALN